MDPRLSRYRVRRAGRRRPNVLLVVGIKRKSTAEPLDLPVDLASRIGMPAAFERPAVAAPETVRRVDGPIEAPRSGRRLLVGANEPLPVVLPVAAPVPVLAPAVVLEPTPEAPAMAYAPLPATIREAPGAGEMDLVVTPLPTPDDWHHFELALRRVPGVGTLRTEYYRAGILKLRVRWSGAERFAEAVGKVPGYRVGILGEDRSTVQIRVARG